VSARVTSAFIELSFPSELGYEAFARDTVAAFARHTGFDQARIDDLKTALGEACINAIEHGNMLRPDLFVRIRCRAGDARLLVEVCDAGLQQFTAQEIEPLSIEQKIAGFGSLRGMGLMLIMQLADETSCETDAHGGNCFRLIWYQ
jgi:serine/threonine-protein kinase RsbW